MHRRAPKGSGGVGILLEDNIFNEYHIKVVDKTVDGIIGLEIKHKLSDFSLLVYSCYLPPENSPHGRDAVGFYSHLLTELYTHEEADGFVVCGDLNSRIGNLNDSITGVDNIPCRKVIDEVVNQHGNVMIEFLEEAKMCVVNGRVNNKEDNFTCRTSRGLSVVDYFIVPHDMLSSCKQFMVVPCLDIIEKEKLQTMVNRRCRIPDHNLLTLEISVNVQEFISHTSTVDLGNSSTEIIKNNVFYDVRKVPNDFMSSEFCVKAMLDIIDAIESSREEQAEIDQIYAKFTDAVIEEMNNTIPNFVIGGKSKKRLRTRKSFWNDELQNLWNEMHNREKLLKSFNSKQDKRIKLANFKECQYKFDKKYRYYERNSRYNMSETIDNLNTSNPKQFWEEIKKFGPKQKQKQLIPLEVYDENHSIVHDPKIVIDHWQRDFYNLYNNFTAENDEKIGFLNQIKTENEIRERQITDPVYTSNRDLNRNIDISEVRKYVYKAKNKKSPGIDLLPNEVLKNDVIINILTHLFQLCLNSGKIPAIWRKAIISPIPKSSSLDSRIPTNYRGISLISCVAKIYSCIINSRISDLLQEEDKIVDEQNGFRCDRSCQDHIFSLDSVIRKRINQNIPTFTAFIDLQKAFDCVNRDFLISKILKCGIDGKVFSAIKSLYTSTEACIKLPRGIHSDWFETLYGVRQGDNLSPTLFSIFINDLADDIKKLNVGIETSDGKLALLLYADDIVLLAPSEENLQVMLDEVANWTNKWAMGVNPVKSQIVHFRRKGVRKTGRLFKCGDNSLKTVPVYKYLGIMFSEHLSYDENAITLSQAGGRALGSIIAKYKAQGFMGYSTYTKLFDSCITPILDYAAGVWGFSKYNCIEGIQNRATRIFLGVHKFAPKLGLEGDMGWMSCYYRHCLSMLRLWNRLIKLPANRLTKKIFVDDFHLALSGHDNWSSNVLKVLSNVKLESLFYEQRPIDIEMVKEKLMDMHEENWLHSVSIKPKLRTYKLFKETLHVENYVLYNLSISERSVMAQFRLGILPLNIETGRFRNQPIEERICDLCELNEIEDESHFLFKCTLYNDLRKIWMENILRINENFVQLDEISQMKIMFDKHHRCTAKFILRSLKIRKENIAK
jgi:hypothetical protein